MDPLLLAARLPKLAERAMRDAIIAQSLAAPAGRRALSPRHLVDDALLRFERAVQRVAVDGIRPALLFAERDRIVRELRLFTDSRLAARLFAVRLRDVLAVGRDAAPFDAVVRGRRGGLYGVVLRRLRQGHVRLETLRAIRSAARKSGSRDVRGVLVYDFASGTVRTLRTAERAVELSAA